MLKSFTYTTGYLNFYKLLMATVKEFENLEVWQLSIQVTEKIYSLMNSPDLSKDFVLRNQLWRSIISISSNIVEGFEKNNNKEFRRFLKIAKGSTGEARSQVIIMN